jgi:hypothetical protein
MRKRKLLRARDLSEQGLPTITLTRLVQTGKLDRVARGLYSLPYAAMSEHRSLAEVALLVPRGVKLERRRLSRSDRHPPTVSRHHALSIPPSASCACATTL